MTLDEQFNDVKRQDVEWAARPAARTTEWRSRTHTRDFSPTWACTGRRPLSVRRTGGRTALIARAQAVDARIEAIEDADLQALSLSSCLSLECTGRGVQKDRYPSEDLHRQSELTNLQRCNNETQQFALSAVHCTGGRSSRSRMAFVTRWRAVRATLQARERGRVR